MSTISTIYDGPLSTYPASWCGEFIGIPFRDHGRDLSGFDCWGLARHVLQNIFSVTGLPDYCESYSDAKNHDAVSRAVAAGLAHGWRRLTDDEMPCEGDLIILNLAGHPWHCAISAGTDWMIHCVDGIGVVAEQWTRAIWKKRVEGFYRNAG